MKTLIGFAAIFALLPALLGQQLPTEEPLRAREHLLLKRSEIRANPPARPAAAIRRMIALGMWTEAAGLLARYGNDPSVEMLAARWDWAIARHHYQEAEEIAAECSAFYPKSIEALLMRSTLFRRAWLLQQAAKNDQAMVAAFPDSVKAWECVGETLLLMRKYDEALRLGNDLQQKFPRSGAGPLLAAKALFWKEDLTAASAALERSLKLEPLNADARFYYGYAIWRGGDATRLQEMASHWEVALALEPLHYLTHWHWGNGHTPLTFADYADPDEMVIRETLSAADSLIALGEMDEAIEFIRGVGENHFSSAIPDLYLGSAWYLHPGTEMLAGQDSAIAAFQKALKKKPHFGPAHNGIAAAIKMRQMWSLGSYDSLEIELTRLQITDSVYFPRLFPDVYAYPGERVPKMVWSQLHTSKAYFPLLVRLNRQFRIPPLHQDLALAMNNPWFRNAVTFDNRKWMDIRGVGSGATGIEYVERGAHLERNVTLHEFIHLVHGMLLSEKEVRRISALYFKAMEEKRTLDYYAASNEFEYFAQAYPAYFSKQKVHPLNHKSLNTRYDLEQKDPALYAFIDSLVKKEQAALSGKPTALAENWAQAYISLANEAMQSDRTGMRAQRLLDSALVWAPGYRPALIARAEIAIQLGKFQEARTQLDALIKGAPAYAPAFIALAKWETAQTGSNGPASATWEKASQHLQQAIRLESDPQIRAGYHQQLWEHHLRFGRIQEAVSAAEAFTGSAKPVSSYLRDKIREAQAFAAEQKGIMGYLEEAEAFFAPAIAQNPHDESLTLAFARVLDANEKPDQALESLIYLEETQSAAGSLSGELVAWRVWLFLQKGDTAGARRALLPVRDGETPKGYNHALWVRIHLALGEEAQARKLMQELSREMAPLHRAEFHYLTGKTLERTGDSFGAMNAYDRALGENPYHLEARLALLQRLADMKDAKEIRKVAGKGALLPLPPGPMWQEKFAELQQLRWD
jgi:predicted Zn-dependent protease